MGEVVPHQVWCHKVTGKTASLFGAVPYTGDHDKDDWELVTVGWTVKHPDGTRGVGRFAMATQEEAQAWVDAHPNFKGMSQD